MKTDESVESSSLDEQLIGSNNEGATVEVKSFLRCPKLFLTVEPIIGAVFLSDALSGAVITNFIISRTCEVHFHLNKSSCSDFDRKDQNEIESLVQPYAAMILTSMSILSVFFPAIMSLFLGPWSDNNGRKLLLTAPVLGYFLKYLLLAAFVCIPSLDSTFGLVTVLPVALTGGIVNFISAGYSYISDISREEDRSFRISILEAFGFCGSIIGISCVSPIFKAGGSNGYLLIFGLCASINFLAFIFSYFLISESVQATENGKGMWHIFELKLLKDMLKVCFKKREESKRAVIFLIIISLTLTISVMEGESNVKFLFVRLRFGWNIHDFTVWSAVSMAVTFFGLISGSVILSKWLKIPDAIIGLISYTMELCGSFYQAFVPSNSSYMMYYVGLVKLFGGLCAPSGRAVLSKCVPKEDLGKVFALTGSSESLFPLAITPLYTLLYSSTIGVLPNAFLFLSASFYFLCCIFFVTIFILQRKNQTIDYQSMEN